MPTQIAELFLDHSVRKLDQMSSAIELCLSKLSEEQVWLRGSGNENAVGNLVLHLCGNIKHYIGHVVAGEHDRRERDKEFLETHFSVDELKNLLKISVFAVNGTLKNLSVSRLVQRVQTTDGERSVLEVIYQVVGHFQQHTGQIIFATKQLTGEDLQIYKPPKS